MATAEVDQFPKNEVIGPVGDACESVRNKLLLVCNSCRKHSEKRRTGSLLSKRILEDNNVYISPDECTGLLKRLPFFTNRSRIICITMSFVTAMWVFYASGTYSAVSLLFVLALLPLILSFFSHATTMAGLLTFDPRQLLPPLAGTTEALDRAAVIIVSRNEPFEVAKMTFDSALSLDYPLGKLEIIVVDNSDCRFPEYLAWKDYVESFCENGFRSISGIRVVFVHREGTEGFKPRNLDIALNQVSADYILYLDVDSTVHKDTLMRIIPMFKNDESLGFVQLHTAPTNAKDESPLALTQSLRNYFLRLETLLNTYISHSLFYGHNAVWRTSVVREMGDCLEYHRDEVVVTEDISMSFRARFLGYHGVGACLESGEWVPETMRDTEAMWLRWTVGTYQVYSKHFRDLKNLKKLRKSEIAGWLQHVGVLVNYGLLPIYLVLGLVLNSTLLMSMAALSFLPEFVQVFCAFHKLSLDGMKPIPKIMKLYSSFLVLGAFINWVKCVGLLRYLARLKQGWVPTGKATEGDISFYTVLSERWAFLLFGVGCLSYSLFLLAFRTEGVIESVLVAACGIHGFNSILSVVLFGRSSMHEDPKSAVSRSNIKKYDGFYLK